MPRRSVVRPWPSVLVRCVVDCGWPLREAERFQVSPTTAARWAGRYRRLGPVGMVDRSSRPHRSPRRTPTRTEPRIINVRVTRRWGPARCQRNHPESACRQDRRTAKRVPQRPTSPCGSTPSSTVSTSDDRKVCRPPAQHSLGTAGKRHDRQGHRRDKPGSNLGRAHQVALDSSRSARVAGHRSLQA
jgi:hypothetical protein